MNEIAYFGFYYTGSAEYIYGNIMTILGMQSIKHPSMAVITISATNINRHFIEQCNPNTSRIIISGVHIFIL